MERREFITLLGGTAMACPLAARAQQAMRVIGFPGASTASSQGQWAAAFAQRLREHGWIEGRTMAIEYRWAEGRSERVAEIIAEFVRLKVDVIVTHSNALAVAAKQATSVIPTVFGAVGDPVSTGLGRESCTARRQHYRAVASADGYRRQASRTAVRRTARALGIEVATAEIRRAADIAPAFEALRDQADALYVCNDPFLNANAIQINTSAAAVRLPTIFNFRENVEAGGLMSYETCRTCSAAPPIMSTGFCAGRSLAIFRWSSRPNSSWSSTSRPPRRLASIYHPRCSPVPIRSSNEARRRRPAR
jgi:putative tryptophan/tyrosine transport system substrate-binding protein